jgi:O-antigen/teichoic acid export membrane protein
MMVGVVIAAIVNLALNAVLIPFAGIVGAAAATLMSEALLAVLAFVYGRKHLKIRFPALQMLKFLAMAASMYWVVVQVELTNNLLDLLAKVVVGCVAYAVLAIACDSRTRIAVRTVLGRLRPAEGFG